MSLVLGDDWWVVAVVCWLAAALALVLVAVALRRSAQAWVAWAACGTGALALAVLAFAQFAKGSCDRALAAPTGVWGSSSTCGGPDVLHLLVIIELPAIVLLGCLAFLASPLLKRWVASSKPAHLVVSVAVVAVGVGVLIVARPAPAGERPNTVNVLVAVGPIGTGTTARDALDSGRIALQPIRLVDVRRDAIGNIKVIKDMVTVRRIRPGEQLTMQQFGASDGPATP